MIDRDGKEALFCDCAKNINNECLHILLIKHYHDQIGDPLFEGEEPKAFLIFHNYHDIRYLYSIASASGSEKHHSHKRTIVICKDNGNWNCKACARQK